MKTIEFSTGSGLFDRTATSSNKAKERLDYLRARQAGDSSPFIKRQYQTALADYRLACSTDNSMTQDHNQSGMNSSLAATDLGSAASSVADWLRAKARLEHLRVRKIQAPSSYVTREYQHTLTEFRRVCSAGKSTQ